MATSPSGTIISVATVFAASKTVSAITNAAEATLTVTAHGYSVGDILQVFSGWGRLDRAAIRVKSTPTADTFVAEKINTTNTEFYPAGSGIGTVRKVTTFQQINKVLNPTNSGGEAKTITVKFLESDVETVLNDGFTAITESFDIDADEFGSTAYNALLALHEVQSDTIVKKTLKSGTSLYTPGRIALNENVKFNDGSILTNAVSISGNGRLTRY